MGKYDVVSTIVISFLFFFVRFWVNTSILFTFISFGSTLSKSLTSCKPCNCLYTHPVGERSPLTNSLLIVQHHTLALHKFCKPPILLGSSILHSLSIHFPLIGKPPFLLLCIYLCLHFSTSPGGLDDSGFSLFPQVGQRGDNDLE